MRQRVAAVAVAVAMAAATGSVASAAPPPLPPPTASAIMDTPEGPVTAYQLQGRDTWITTPYDQNQLSVHGPVVVAAPVTVEASHARLYRHTQHASGDQVQLAINPDDYEPPVYEGPPLPLSGTASATVRLRWRNAKGKWGSWKTIISWRNVDISNGHWQMIELPQGRRDTSAYQVSLNVRIVATGMVDVAFGVGHPLEMA